MRVCGFLAQAAANWMEQLRKLQPFVASRSWADPWRCAFHVQGRLPPDISPE